MSVIPSYACFYYTTNPQSLIFQSGEQNVDMHLLDYNSPWDRSGATPCKEYLFHSLWHSAHLSKVTMPVFNWAEGAEV